MADKTSLADHISRQKSPPPQNFDDQIASTRNLNNISNSTVKNKAISSTDFENLIEMNRRQQIGVSSIVYYFLKNTKKKALQPPFEI